MSEVKELKHLFFELVSNYTYTSEAEILWQELNNYYNSEGRAYHNFDHICHFYDQLHTVKDEISSWETILFSLFYHDAIYDVKLHDNEERSAELAVKRLSEIGVAAQTITNVQEQILATKGHVISEDHDTNLFTDADLAILGNNSRQYVKYAESIRQEYSIYPDDVYHPARIKVLRHFLEMEHIFKTLIFRELETKARENILMEIEKLS